MSLHSVPVGPATMQAAGRRKAGKKESESLVSHGPSHSYPKQQTLSAGPTVAFP